VTIAAVKINITNNDCVFVALVIQHAKRTPVRFYTIFLHYLINGTILGNMLLNIKYVS
jgi:hypothetical protein